MLARPALAGVNQWTLKGGGVAALAVDPVTPTKLYMSTLYSGLYKSTNGGTSWTALVNTNVKINLNLVTSLAVDPKTPATLYACNLAGVYKSIDSGANWAFVANDIILHFGSSAGCTLTVDPVTPATLYATLFGVGGGVFKSIDSGAHWTVVNNGLPNQMSLTLIGVGTLAMDPRTTDTLYVGTLGSTQGGGVFRSNDGGAIPSTA